MAIAEYSNVTREELKWLMQASRAPRLRSMGQFAEDEIILPNGPRAGMHFSLATQPWTRLWLEEVESGRWQIINTTGGRQGGKTLVASQTPLLYHLFEVGETVIYLIPDMELAAYKWQEDLRPIIMRTRYRELIPTRGAGSRGGKVSEIKFSNGASLIFMTGGGGDAGRAGRTARVVIVTETDKLDDTGGNSEETDKISQVIHCTDAFGSRRRIYMECTLTTKTGRTWREYETGTASRIALHCPHCGGWVCPGREHLTGWQGAESELDAMEKAQWSCPACGQAWTEEERYRANAEALLVHRGQEVTNEGTVDGPLPRTRTLGFRWSSVNNMFMSAGDVAAEEWKLEREEDDNKRELKEREILQYLWAMPYVDPLTELQLLDSAAILARPQGYKRGEVPEWARWLTVGCDVGKRAIHWAAVAWGEDARGQVVDYGVVEVHGDEEAEERAVYNALRRFKDDYLDPGWIDPKGGRRKPDKVLVDSRWRGVAVKQFSKEAGGSYWPTLGYGTTQMWRGSGLYRKPTRVTGLVMAIGDGYHLEAIPAEGARVVKIDADYWKGWLQRRLETPAGEAGSLGLFITMHPKEHLAYSKHLTSEREVTEFVAGRGNVTKWEQVSRNNHWLDATALSCVGGHLAGVRLIGKKKVEIDLSAMKPGRSAAGGARRVESGGGGGGFGMDDGRPFMITER